MAEKINIGHFCISNPKESNSYSRIYLAKPEKRFLEKFGRLGILINLNFKGDADNKVFIQAQEWSQALIDFISSNFYNTLRSATDIEKEFEQLLQEANKWIQKQKARKQSSGTAQQDLFEKYFNDADIDIIVIKNNEVHFSSIGTIKKYLISEDKINELTIEKSRSMKFSNLMSGTLEQNNVLLFATQNLFDYFSLKKVVQLLKELPAKTAVNEIKQLLSEENARLNILGLVISNRDESLLLSKEQKQDSDEKVMLDSDKIKQPEKVVPLKIPIKEVSAKKKKKHLPAQTKKPRTIYWQKPLLVILLIFGFLFILSLIFLGNEEYKAQQVRKYAQIVETLRAKDAELSVALIYSDTSKTKNLFSEMKQLLDEVPQKTDEQKQTYDLFSNKYTQRLNKFYHLVVIDNPELLIDLSEQYKKISTGGLTNLFNDFYIFNPENNYIYRFNVETKETELVNNTSTHVGRIMKLLPLDNDNLIGYDQNNGLLKFNTIDNKLIPLKLDRAHEQGGINDLCVYNRRLYILESSNNQIYKYSLTIDGFGKEEAWIQDETNISGALYLTINGSVYILKKGGEMYKLHKNKRVEFNLVEIEPLLSVADPNITSTQQKVKLFADVDMKYIYVLDGPTKRLLILTKQGNLVKQFTSPQFDDLKDFIVNKKENTAWLLAGTKIFEIELK